MAGNASGAGAPQILIPVAPGELIDKITILEIKAERMSDPEKLANVAVELDLLNQVCEDSLGEDAELAALAAALKEVNGRIWDLEDVIRDCERRKDFGEVFLDTARKIYRTNDERAAIKKHINLALGSAIVEEKSYSEY
jgi:hypothetical protein